MKQKDIALYLAIGTFSAILSVVIANFLITPQKEKNQKAEVVQSISISFKQPDPKYFNKDAINPTQVIQIGDANNNTGPFSGSR